jgi:hypothetical protein
MRWPKLMVMWLKGIEKRQTKLLSKLSALKRHSWAPIETLVFLEEPVADIASLLELFMDT